MANFSPTDYIVLSGGSEETSGQLTWTIVSSSTTTADVVDVGNDNTLTQDIDTFNFVGSVYSGWYITINGNNYGIFSTNIAGFYTIPYDESFDDLGVQPFATELLAGETTLFDDTLENAANCFLTGTRIATPEGARAIETLKPGDLVVTSDGTATPVVWVWQQEVTNIFGLGDARAPILVAAHALGRGCPSRDLIVTADHALLVEGMLINAGALVNGTTIAAVPLAKMPARFSYWHIETEAHVALLAEDCPAESFIDYTPRAAFDNHAAYLARYGEDRIIPEMAAIRISTARLLPPSVKRALCPALAS